MTFLPDAFEFVFDAFLFARTDCWPDYTESSKDRMIAAAASTYANRSGKREACLIGVNVAAPKNPGIRVFQCLKRIARDRGGLMRRKNNPDTDCVLFAQMV
ncbi:hypothetical protein [Bradyrhizobium sp. G127]|jgi:hypothetical protein|uniref:hypothetical protein n=1 Tax=Bradyrhizobium sp. G127 TaxID=2904800 RepID=UPI001F270590|nr:hypothetical protein [Bradyrhizobium sp. G127]MCF2522786.1 hypothetical protein [Bradyrhizobium sp. G127]